MTSRTYRLLIDTPIKIGLRTKEHGRNVFRPYTLKPNLTYSLDKAPVNGDEAVIKQLKEYEIPKHRTPSLESKLKALNIPYTTKPCKSCGGMVTKILYKPIEVIE